MKWLAACGLGLLFACGGSIQDQAESANTGGWHGAGGSGGGGIAGQTGAGSSGAANNGPAKTCGGDVHIPWEGYACTQKDYVCSCADDPRPECQTTAVCGGDLTWHYEHPACPPPEPTQCPPSVVTARDQLCAPEGAACAYPGEVQCYCVGQSYLCGKPSLAWYCGDSNCPNGVPDLGSSCTVEGQNCGGNACFNPYARVCSGGIWVAEKAFGECV
ncbi:MAG TPA: hypothetical protein VGJ84_17600 [Polyangiaceae bacterium]|jgi:hypothetical protein